MFEEPENLHASFPKQRAFTLLWHGSQLPRKRFKHWPQARIHGHNARLTYNASFHIVAPTCFLKLTVHNAVVSVRYFYYRKGQITHNIFSWTKLVYVKIKSSALLSRFNSHKIRSLADQNLFSPFLIIFPWMTLQKLIKRFGP